MKRDNKHQPWYKTGVSISDEDFKATITKRLQLAITNLLETNEKNSPSREIEAIKKNQMEILEWKNTITEFFKCSGWAQLRNGMTNGKHGKE